jgi:hypothetical protein
MLKPVIGKNQLEISAYNFARNGDIESLKKLSIDNTFKNKNFQIYYEAAKLAQIDMIDWLKNNNYKFDDDIKFHIVSIAGYLGNMLFITELQKRNMLINKSYITCSLYAGAIETENIQLLDWLISNKLYPQTIDALNSVRDNHFWFIEWCIENKCEWKHTDICTVLTQNNNFTKLIWFREHECPWNESVPRNAIWNGNMDILKYAIINKCPFPFYMSQDSKYKLVLESVRDLLKENYNWVP